VTGVRDVATCPACGIESSAESGDCPRCHLSAALFEPVREAAGVTGEGDPAYLRTIGELLATVDLEKSPAPAAGPPTGLLTRPARSAGLAEAPPPSLPTRSAPALAPGLDLPPAPPSASEFSEVRRRIQEYLQVGRRLGLDFTNYQSRASAAVVAADDDSLEILAREMFVHLSSSIVEEYESLLARRNELAQLVPTSSADVEITAVRKAIGVGDLAGAARRLEHVRDELASIEQQWEVGRILVTEADLMVTTIRELGGDPSPAAGPLEEGRKLFAEGHRADSERVLARAAVALWTVLQPRLLADLRRLRDRLLEARSAGLDIAAGIADLRAVATELRQRNFVGTIVAYRRLRGFVDRVAAPGAEGPLPAELGAELRTSPPA
jgi:hypothetical protein